MLVLAVALSTPFGASLASASVGRAPSKPCTRPVVIGVRGSGETANDHEGYGKTVAAAIDEFRKAWKHPLTPVPLDYPSRNIWTIATGRFSESVTDGVDTLIGELGNREASGCPIVLVGYSQGAMVIHLALQRLDAIGAGVLAQIASVELVADPLRSGSAPYTKGSAPSDRNGAGVALGTFGSPDLPAGPAVISDSFCVRGDLVCATGPAAALRLANLPTSPQAVAEIIHGWNVHTHYFAGPLLRDAGRLAAERVRGVVDQRQRCANGEVSQRCNNLPTLDVKSVVTTDTFGPVVFGTNVAEAQAASRLSWRVDSQLDDCAYYVADGAPQGVRFMVIDDTVVRVDIDTPAVRTRSGLGVGTSEAEILRAFPTASVTPHEYTDGHYVTITDSATGNKVVFETDGATVTTYRAGRAPEVEYVEGCA